MKGMLKGPCVSMMMLLCPAFTHADVVLDWNEIMQTTLRGQQAFPGVRFA